MTDDLTVTMDHIKAAVAVMRQHFSAAPLVRSYALEKALGLDSQRRVWIKDYGWTPVGSFKLMGALNWMHNNCESIGNRPVVAHSSGNFASGIAFAGMRYGKRVIVVMPDTAPQRKCELTRSFGAEIRQYERATDHQTGMRERLAKEIVQQDGGILAHPYDDDYVIVGNGVGGYEIVDSLKQQQREVSHMFCAVSGGGLMAGHALAITDGFPEAQVIGVEPAGACDFQQSLTSGKRIRIDRPDSICDGLLSYDVGEKNWPILKRCVSKAIAITDQETKQAMLWLYQNHGLRSEPSGAITTAAVLSRQADLTGTGDIVIILSGRNVDEGDFQSWLSSAMV